MHNIPFNQLKVGDTASLNRTLTMDDVKLFARVSGDNNPIHLDPEYAKNTIFGKNIAHGLWGGSLISTVIGTQLPGPGAIYLHQDFDFKAPIFIGDTVTAKVTIINLAPEKKIVTLQCECTNQDQKLTIGGTAIVIASDQKIGVIDPKL